jgi:hypothetical protein
MTNQSDNFNNAIPTLYKGVQLKSRLEAQAAVLFDKLGWKWEYEKFSFMLPSGIPYIPDFWMGESVPWLMVECRGYSNDRGDRQIDEFVDLVEEPGGFDLGPEVGNLYNFIVVGPERVSLYESHPTVGSAYRAGTVFYNKQRLNAYSDIPATKRFHYQNMPAMLYHCACGWRTLNERAWCPDCEQHATAAILLSLKIGKIFVNGTKVEDWNQ